MASEYRRLLVPKGAVFLPSGAAVAALVEALEKQKWLPSPGSDVMKQLRFDGAPLAAKTGAFARRTAEPDEKGGGMEPLPHPLSGAWVDDPDRSDVVLRWPVAPQGAFAFGPSTLRYPLTRVEDVPQPVSYAIEIHRADDFVYPTYEGIGALDATCECGEDLSFEWDPDEIVSPFGQAGGIFTECEECSRTFDPAKRDAEIADPFTKRRTRVRGGAAYRFALVVDCGRAFPKGGEAPAIHPELKTLVETAFGRDFHEIGALA